MTNEAREAAETIDPAVKALARYMAKPSYEFIRIILRWTGNDDDYIIERNWRLFIERATEYVKIVRAHSPLPEATPDPRDEALRLAREALASIAAYDEDGTIHVSVDVCRKASAALAAIVFLSLKAKVSREEPDD